jgi:serine O-acetyltransferase
LEADRIALARGTKRPSFEDDIWKFEILLRKVEYRKNCKHSSLSRLYLKSLYLRFHLLGRKLGFTIPPNTFGPGLAIAHRGTIVVHFNARVGENCRVHVCTDIGTEARYGDKAPRIGNNVYLGPGAKIFGDITIGDDSAIAANAVVNRSFPEPHQTIGGIPAQKISGKGSEGLLIRATDILRNKKS